jgi:hypothetical protein
MTFFVGTQAEAEGIERRILALESEIRDRAADAAHRHVFSSRENEPVGDCSPHKLEKGLAATAQVGLAADIKDWCHPNVDRFLGRPLNLVSNIGVPPS